MEKITIMDRVYVTCDHNNCGDHGFDAVAVEFSKDAIKVGYKNMMEEYKTAWYPRERVEKVVLA